jgi:hypothetical protein
MSGPAGSRDHQPRGTGALTEIPIKSIARSPERAQESCAFLLTLTYIDGDKPGTTLFLDAAAFIGTNRERGGSGPLDGRIGLLAITQNEELIAFGEELRRDSPADAEHPLHRARPARLIQRARLSVALIQRQYRLAKELICQMRVYITEVRAIRDIENIAA